MTPVENNSAPVVAATVLGLTLPTGALLLRHYGRPLLSSSNCFVEDALIIAAWVFKVGLDVAGIILLCNGLGRHITDVAPSTLVTFIKTQYTGSFLYPLCITCIKLSVLVQYRRITSGSLRWFAAQVYVLMAVVVIWCFCSVVTAAVLCIPIQSLWNPQVHGSCLDLTAFYYGIQIPNVITDLLMIVCPIHMLMSLDIERKLAGIAVFLLGTITLVFDIVRLAVLVKLSQSSSKDITYDEVGAAVWTTLEPAAAIITVCIPAIRLVKRSRRMERKTSAGTRAGAMEEGKAFMTGHNRLPSQSVASNDETKSLRINTNL